jgi:adenine-specific DNA-methyltransferase
MLDIENLGQVFTTPSIVSEMLSLRKNIGSILEPSCGAGAFFNQIPNCIGIEYDSLVCPKTAINMNFFDFSIDEKFDTIIGNPPYVKYKNIGLDTKNKLDLTLFDARSNLYLFFIEKCIKHLKNNGELIFIVPRDFIKASSAVNLNKFIYNEGTITHWIDLGDKVVFPGFSPNCVIFRFQKNDFSRVTFKDGKKCQFIEMNGQLIFSSNIYPIQFSDLFLVKVGAVSGADKLFTNSLGNMDFVCSDTRESGRTRKMFYNIESPELLVYKEELLKRKVKVFNEKNWYMWGRGYYQNNLPRIYVNNKTRKNSPFFTHSCNAYDGSVLALFPKFEIDNETLKILCSELNNINWEELGFMCGNRYLFTQRSLEQAYLPEIFRKYLKKIDN